jgi:hypothetical protein
MTILRAGAVSVGQLVEPGDHQRADRSAVRCVHQLHRPHANLASRLRPPPYGIPYVGVGSGEPRVPVTFVDYGDESDNGFGSERGYPIPDAAKTQPNFIEGGRAGGGSDGDRHVLIVDRDRWLLFELYATRWTGQRWEAGLRARSTISRPTAGVRKAGRPPMPRASRSCRDWCASTKRGAGRFNTRCASPVRGTNGYVWPASHRAGSTGGALPLGARLRLKTSKDISRYPAYIQNIFRGMQTHGLIVADNGSDMYVSGAMDPRWNNDELNPAFRALTAADFDVIRLGWR